MRNQSVIEVRSCVKCGKSFRATTRHQTQKFCSRECHGARVQKKECPTCGSTFQPKLNRTIYCSASCAWNRVRRAATEGVISQ